MDREQLLIENKHRHNESGFTLLETLLALAIFTLIGFATVKHIQQISNTKTMALSELDTYDNIRAVVSLLRFDLSQAFHILYDDLGGETKSSVLQNIPVAHTLFDGRKKELVFTSLSHRVYYAGAKECTQTEISYFLQNRGGKLPYLMKRESGFIDSDLYAGGQVYTLLEDVSNLEFFYWNAKTGKWVDDWNSDNGDFRDIFPMAVKMRVAITPAGKSPLVVESEFKLAFPNNTKYLVQF